MRHDNVRLVCGEDAVSGRFALFANTQSLEDYLQAEMPVPIVPRYNIAPTTPVLAKTSTGITFFQWGLVPAWSRDIRIGNRLFNARVETVTEKTSFRHAFVRRRCLLPASGFYVWQTRGEHKQPWFCHLDEPLFCFAAVWEHWQDGMGNELQSCALLTLPSTGIMERLSERMPVVIREERFKDWLDHGDENTDMAFDCIADLDESFRVHEVSTQVNSTRNEGSDLIKPVETD